MITLLHCYYYYSYRAVHLEVNSCERGRQAKRLAPGVRSSLQCWLVGGGLHPSPSSRTLSRSLGLSGFELQPLGPHSSVSCLAPSKNSRSVIGCVVYNSKSYRSNVLFPDSILICEVLSYHYDLARYRFLSDISNRLVNFSGFFTSLEFHYHLVTMLRFRYAGNCGLSVVNAIYEHLRCHALEAYYSVTCFLYFFSFLFLCVLCLCTCCHMSYALYFMFCMFYMCSSAKVITVI